MDRLLRQGVKQKLTSPRISFTEDENQDGDATIVYGQREITALVRAASRGNFDAFGKLYHVYIERIYRYVLYQVKDKMVAEDITADVFVRALDSIESCKGREATFSSWLYRIAYNRTMDNFRSARRNVSVDTDKVTNLPDPGQEPTRSLEWRDLQDAVMDLPHNQKQVIILKFIEGLDNREIGQVMGKSQVAVRLLQLRGLTALRDKVTRR